MTIDFRRKNEPPGIAQITLGKNKDRDQGVLGIRWWTRRGRRLPMDFHLANVGPSAGLMFSLAVVDKAHQWPPGWVDVRRRHRHDRRRWQVGQIGGITHKMAAAPAAGAMCFWCPRRTARGQVPTARPV